MAPERLEYGPEIGLTTRLRRKRFRTLSSDWERTSNGCPCSADATAVCHWMSPFRRQIVSKNSSLAVGRSWVRLHAIYQREIVDERDRFYLAVLRQLGIERASRSWFLAIDLDDSAQRGPDYDQLLERASWFYEAVSFSAAMRSQIPGAGRAYLGAYTDGNGDWLDGSTYTIHIPAAGQALLVVHRLPRRQPLPHRQRPTVRRPRVTPSRPGTKRRRLGRGSQAL